MCRRRQHPRCRQNRRRGNIVVLTAFLMVLILAMTAFAVDVAFMQMVRGELRAATDLAARAGAETILRTRDEAQARATAQDIARANRVGGRGLELRDSEVVFGQVTTAANGTQSFVAGRTPFNACQVDGSRTASSLGGGVPLFFGPFLGVQSFQPTFTAVVTREFRKRDMAIVVDRSGSMNAPSGSGGTKWDSLLIGFDGLLANLGRTPDNEQIGLVSYSSSSTIDAHMTTNYPSVRTALHAHSPGGFTNITAGIVDGLTILQNARPDADVEKFLVVMTDGLHTTGVGPMSTVNAINSQGYKVITITFGADADQSGMQALAAATGGRHFHAPTGQQLEQIFQEIGLGTAGLQYFQ
jgi:hypothetical protein